MFEGCSGLAELNLSSFNTNHVTNMRSMFADLNLSTLDLSGFDTTNLSNVSNMFRNMKNLKILNLSNWKFNDSLSLEFAYSSFINELSSDCKIILKNVDTSEVTNMAAMFAHIKVTELDLSDFDTSNVTNMGNMFYDTPYLEHITFGPKFVHKPEAVINSMFNGCLSQDRPTGDTWNDVSFD